MHSAFLSERMKMKKCNILVSNLYDKKEYVVHIRALKQASNHGLIPKKVHRVTQFNQEAWLRPYIEMNTKLRTQAKSDLQKDFLKLMNNSVFGKTMVNVRKHRHIKLVTAEKRRNQLVSEPNYHTTKYFSENLLAMQMKISKVKMNKPLYLGFSILEISKTLMYEFCMIILNQNIKTMQCYMDTDSFIIHIATEDFYKHIADDIKNRYDTSNHEVDRPLPKGMNKKCHRLNER